MADFPGLTGWLKDPFDGRDHPFTSSITVKANTSQNLRKAFPESWMRPYNQGRLKSCVANATAAAYAFEVNQARKAGNLSRQEIEPSRLFIYYNARTADVKNVQENGLVDLGSWPRNAMKGLQVLGVCSESTWPYWEGPYNPDNDKKMDVDKELTWRLAVNKTSKTKKVDNYPGKQAYLAAQPHTIVAYERLDVQRAMEDHDEIRKNNDVATMDKDGETVLNNLRQALSEGHPVVFGFFFRRKDLLPLEEGPDKIGKTRQLPVRHGLGDSSKINQRELGGHAVLAIGYDDSSKLILIQNSWGPFSTGPFQNGGQFFWMRYDWITDFDCTSDFWMMRVVKT